MRCVLFCLTPVEYIMLCRELSMFDEMLMMVVSALLHRETLSIDKYICKNINLVVLHVLFVICVYFRIVLPNTL
jgi:hypothetical protein